MAGIQLWPSEQWKTRREERERKHMMACGRAGAHCRDAEKELTKANCGMHLMQ